MRCTHLVLGLVLPLATACSNHAFTPPSRPMPLTTAQAPAPGKFDLQVDGSASGEVLGPSLIAGNARYRHGVTEHVAATADLGFASAGGDSSGTHTNPNAGMTRAGIHVHTPVNDDIAVAGFAGVGGGFASAAGGWVSGDLGGVLSGTDDTVRPMMLVSFYGSQPVASRTFNVDSTMLTLPQTLGVQGLFGFDIGPMGSSVMVGFAVSRLWAMANENQEALSQTFYGLGGGFRFAGN